jgi:hypothetical protein
MRTCETLSFLIVEGFDCCLCQQNGRSIKICDSGSIFAKSWPNEDSALRLFDRVRSPGRRLARKNHTQFAATSRCNFRVDYCGLAPEADRKLR